MPDILDTASARFKAVLLKRKGAALGLWGEAGIGKTYQARVLLQSIPCQRFSVHANTSWIHLTQSLPKAKKTAVWAERTLERVRRGESVDTYQLMAALMARLATLAPVILQAEDLHEADTERLEFWTALAQTVTRVKGVGLLITSRGKPPEPFEAMKLGPLTKEQSDTLLLREISAPLPKEVLEFIYDKAAGNPLYTLEYLRFLSRQGFLWSDGKTWHWRKPEQNVMPVTVEALLELTLDKLQDKRLEAALQAKAFLSLDDCDELWAGAAELSVTELEAVKLEFRQRGIFNDDTFAHPLYREVTLKNLPKATRQQLARRALEVLQDDPVKAASFVDDALLENEKALELFKRAANQIKDISSLEAGRLLARAVQYAQGEQQRQLALEGARLLRGRDDREALRLAQMATKEQPSDEALYCLAEMFASQHRLQEAETTLQQLSEKSRQSNSWPLRLARIYANSFELDKLLELSQLHPDITANDAYVDYIICYAHHYTGDGSRAEQLAREALERPTLQEHERARFLGIFEALAVERSDYEKAIRFSDERIALYRASQQTYSLASALEKRAELLEHLEDYNEQLTYLDNSYKLFSEVGDYRRVTSSQADLAYAFIQRGKYEQAQEILLEARTTLAQLDISDSHLLVEAFLTLLYYEWRPPLATSLALHHAETLTRFEGKWLWPIMIAGTHWTASLVASWLGDPKRALQIAEKGIKTASELHYHNIHAANLHARGLALEQLGQTGAALHSLGQAVTMFQKAKFEARAQRAALELDRLNHDIESARKRRQWFEERGLQNGVNIAKRYFPELAEQLTRVTTTPKNLPRLEVLGDMQLHHHGQSAAVRGRKRQELFSVLLETRLSGRSEVSRLDLLDALYPDSNEDKALGSLKQLVHSLRLELGDSVIKTTPTGYALGDMTSDAELFLQTGDTSLWRGCYLELLSRETVSESLYLLLFDKTKALLGAAPKEAARVAKFLLEYDPYNLPYLTLGLRALRQSDNYRALERVYQEARTHFAEIGEDLPESWTAFLEQQVIA